MSAPDVARVEVHRPQHEQPRPRARVVRVRRRVRVRRGVERGRPQARVVREHRGLVLPPVLQAPPEVVEPRQVRDEVDGDRQQHERDEQAQALLTHRARERPSERDVVTAPARRLPRERQDERGEDRHRARPFDRERAPERDAGREPPRSPERERDRRSGARGDDPLEVAQRLRAIVGFRLGLRWRSTVDPSPVQQQEQEPGEHPELQVDVEQRRARQHDVEALDRHEEPCDERPQRAAEQQLREDRHHRDDQRAGHGRGEAPAERRDAEQLLAHPDRPLAERRMDPRADVPLVVAPVVLVVAVDLADRVGAADQDAAGLRVVVLVEEQLGRTREMREPQDPRDRRHREDGDHRPVQPLQHRGHRVRLQAPASVGRDPRWIRNG